jgi:hypothetical protein
MISISRHHARNVKRWRDGQFRRVNGHLHLPALRAALARHVGAETVTAECDTQTMSAA